MSTKDIVTSHIYPLSFVIEGIYDPPDPDYGWQGGFEIDGIYTEAEYLDYQSDSNYKPTDLQDYLANTIVDRLTEDVINKCRQGDF